MKGVVKFMPLIIHADDFGISESVSKCIVECFSRGWVTETSLMVNMPYADAAIELARRNNVADRVGLHLNLSQGQPLTEDVKKYPRICNQDGSFNKRFHHCTLSRFLLSQEETKALRKEIIAQLYKFCDYSGLMMKLDSHHHLHTDWAVYKILEPIAIKCGFKAMRISATLHTVNFLMWTYKFLLNRRIGKYFAVTQDFDGFNMNLVKATKSTNRIIELMTHPMYGENGEILDAKHPYRDIMEAING